MKLIIILLLCNIPAYSDTGRNSTLVCAACHEGANMQPTWPKLAGQHAKYLREQLHAYIKGTRTDPIMSPMAAELNEDMINTIAEFYEALPRTRNKPQGKTTQGLSPDTAKSGAQAKLALSPESSLIEGYNIYLHGKNKITACVACHGPKGLGNAPAGFPMMIGLHAEYIIKQLQAFKSKQRHNDLNNIMQDISKNMSNTDMASVAEYISQM